MKACRAIRSGLEKRQHQPKDRSPFFLAEGIQQSWEEAGHDHVKDFLEILNIHLFNDYQDLAQRRSIKIMSILIWIGMSDWQWLSFSHHYGFRENQLDVIDLPLSKASSLSGLLQTCDLEDAFQTAQYMFLPLTITENRDLGAMPDKYPLPFLGSHLLVQDTHQTVTEELVAAKHLRRRRGRDFEANQSVMSLPHKARLGIDVRNIARVDGM